jgi:hypothetical protein
LALDENGGDKISGGFLFDSATNHLHISTTQWNTTNGTQIMLIDSVGGTHPPDVNAVTVSQIGGAPFALSSIDVSEAHSDSFFSARQVQITGNVFGGGTVSALLVLDNNLVNGVLGNYFQTFLLSPAFGNLSSFTLIGMGALCCTSSNYYAIDNVVVTSAVPEPGTLSLVGLGSAYLFSRRQRKRH